MKLSEISGDESLTILLYGAGGVGKTFFAGSAASKHNTVIFSPQQGYITLKSPLFRKKYPTADPEIEIIDEIPMPKEPKAFSLLKKKFEQYVLDKETEVLIVDDMTNVRRLAWHSGSEFLGSMGKGNKSLNTAQSKDVDAVLKEMSDYTIEMGIIEAFLRECVTVCKEHKKHLIVTAHERLFFNPPASIGGEATLRKTTPGFTGRTFPDELTGLFDMVWHIEMKGGLPYARTQGSSAETAKTRWGGVFEEFGSLLDFPTVVSKIEKAIQSNTLKEL